MSSITNSSSTYTTQKSDTEPVNSIPMSTIMSFRQQEMLNRDLSSRTANNTQGYATSNNQITNAHSHHNIDVSKHVRVSDYNSRCPINSHVQSLYNQPQNHGSPNNGVPLGLRPQFSLNYNNNSQQNSSMLPPHSEHQRTMSQLEFSRMNVSPSMHPVSYNSPNINTLRPPPRSHSTLGVGPPSPSPLTMNSPLPRQPPAAHQNSSRSTISGLNFEQAHNSSPITAHMSSKTPQTPRVLTFDSLPSMTPKPGFINNSPPGRYPNDRNSKVPANSITNSPLTYPSMKSDIDSVNGISMSAIMNLRQQDMMNRELASRTANTPNYNNSSNHILNTNPHGLDPSKLVRASNINFNQGCPINSNVQSLFNQPQSQGSPNGGMSLGLRPQFGLNYNNNSQQNSSMPPPHSEHRSINQHETTRMNIPKSIVSSGLNVSPVTNDMQLKQYNALINAYQHQHQQMQLQHQQNLLMASQVNIQPTGTNSSPTMMTSLSNQNNLQINTSQSQTMLMDLQKQSPFPMDSNRIVSQQPSPRSTYQRSIITGSASGPPKKNKKVKYSPPIDQATDLATSPPSQYDKNECTNYSETKDIEADPHQVNRPSSITRTEPKSSSIDDSLDSSESNQCNTTPIVTNNLSGLSAASCNVLRACSNIVTREMAVETTTETDGHQKDIFPPLMQDSRNTDSIVPNEPIIKDVSITDIPNHPDNTNRLADPSRLNNNITSESPKTLSQDNNEKLVSQAAAPEIQSKYQKLYTKKAWLQNYDLEDHSRSQKQEIADTVSELKSEIKSEAQDSVSLSSKPDSPTPVEASKLVKNPKKSNKKTISVAKTIRPTKTPDNNPVDSNSSTSELDSDDTSNMATDKKLRRMPRRKVKPASKDNQSLPKSNLLKKEHQPNKSKIVGKEQPSTLKSKILSKDVSKKKSIREPAQDEKTRKRKKFVQEQPCYEIVPKNIRCLECQRVRNTNGKNNKVPSTRQSGKTSWDDFCRFYAFRKLGHNKNSQIVVAGFSDLADVKHNDKAPWLPLENIRPTNINFKVAKFILDKIGDQFCNLVMQERDAQALYQSQNDGEKKITWRRAVNGLRELCDVCATTLFNCHYVCERCGFVVCIECYQLRASGQVLDQVPKSEDCKEEKDGEKSYSQISDCDEGNPKETSDSQAVVTSKKSKRDAYRWIYCNKNVEHCHRQLTLSQIITSDCLEQVWTMLHEVRQRLNLSICACKKKSSNYIKEENHDPMEDASGEDGALTGINNTTHSTLKDLLLAPPTTNDSDEDVRTQHNIHEATSESKDSISGKKSATSNGISQSDIEMFNVSSNEDNIQEDMKLSQQVAAAIEGCISSLHNGSVSYSKEPYDVGNIKLEVEIESENKQTNTNRTLRNSPEGSVESGSNFETDTHSWLCDGELLVLSQVRHKMNIQLFRKQWVQGKPIVVRGVHRLMNIEELWLPQYFGSAFGDYRSDLVDCRNGDIHRHSMKKYWDGFEPTGPPTKKRIKEDLLPTQIPSSNNEECSNGPSYYSGSALWRLKDWPPGQDFNDILPKHYDDFMDNLPLKSYTTRTGVLNLACRLPENMLKPDLGPKMYSAYGTTKFPERGTTNLHLDISDAINVMIYVSGATAFFNRSDEQREIYEKTVADCYVDQQMKDQIISKKLVPGALWHVFKPCDAQKMRDFLNKISDERNISPEKRTDPIHDQTWYLDQTLLDRLYAEFDVKAYAILQCMGDAILIPAGAPHQVKNLQNCIKVANDFVSPENVEFCLQLTNEFRNLPETHMNQEDKLQIKNILYHSVKESLQYIRLFESGKIDSEDLLDDDE